MREIELTTENCRIGKSFFKRFRGPRGSCVGIDTDNHKRGLRQMTNLKKYNARKERRKINEKLNGTLGSTDNAE